MFYDPIGLLQPTLISLKRLLEEICKQKLSWDELLPDDFSNEFQNVMENISITRNVCCKLIANKT